MSLPRFSPKRLKEIADGTRNADGTKKRTGLEDMKKSGLLQKASSFTQKPRKRIKPRSPKNKGWVDVALALWNKEGNERCCEVCGIHLGEDFSPTWYHHMLHRGSYRSMKREPRNLAQVCLFCHDVAHEFGIESLATEASQYQPTWKKLWARMLELRNEANGIEL